MELLFPVNCFLAGVAAVNKQQFVGGIETKFPQTPSRLDWGLLDVEL